MAVRERIEPEKRNIVDISWDPVTRIVGNLGIYTKIDFDNQEVIECRSTSSIFRGYSVFMKGKDPRDAGFITSRICGICGDNHTVCSNYAQNRAFGSTNPPLAEIIINLGEAAEYMFDHTIFQDNLVFVDFCEQMVKETNPSVLAKAEKTEPTNADVFDFFYEALPGYHEVGLRRTLLGCWGAFQDPWICDHRYDHMEEWGRAMYVTPGVVVDGELVTTSLVDINLGLRILLGSSYYEDWANETTFVDRDPLGNKVDQRHPWNQTTIPAPQKRDLEGGKYSWVMSPRWLHNGEHLALDTGRAPPAGPLWAPPDGR